MRWTIIYQTPVSTGRADAVGATKEEAESDFRQRYGYFSRSLYRIIRIVPS